MSLNVRWNDDDIVRLRHHIRESHRNLLEPVVDGPLPADDLSSVPPDVLIAIHQANHMGLWSPHAIDDWSDE